MPRIKKNKYISPELKQQILERGDTLLKLTKVKVKKCGEVYEICEGDCVTKSLDYFTIGKIIIGFVKLDGYPEDTIHGIVERVIGRYDDFGYVIKLGTLLKGE